MRFVRDQASSRTSALFSSIARTSTRIVQTLINVFALALVGFALPQQQAFAQEFRIESYDLVDRSRVSRAVTEFTYSVQLTNQGPDYQNVIATAVSNSSHTMVVIGELHFGDMVSGDTVTSQQTLIIRHDRRYPFSWDENVSWEFSQDSIVGDSFRVGPEGGAFNDLKGTSVIVPPGALTEDRLISVETYGDAASQFVSGPYLAGARFGPSGLTFDQPISVTFSLSESVPEGAELLLISYDQDQSAWSVTDFVATANPGGQSATAEISHFSDYFVMELGMSQAVVRFKNSYFDSCNIRPVTEIYSELKQEVFEMFPVESERIWSNFWVENPAYGYNCYAINGLRVSLRGERYQFSEGGITTEIDSIERSDPIGATGEYFSFHLIDDEQVETSSLACGDYAFTYSLDIFILWKPGGGKAALEVDYDEPLCVGQDAQVRASLTCGDEPYPDVWVSFFSNLGPITPDGYFTNQEGLTSWATYSPGDEGEDRLIGQFDALANVYISSSPQPVNTENLFIDVDACPYVDVVPPAKELFVDSEEIFTATLRRADDEEMPQQDFEWNASNARISVSPVSPDSATVKGQAPGSVVLSAETTLDSGEVVTGSADIEVLPADLRLEIDQPAACLIPGETIELSATVYDINDEPQTDLIYSWSSSDENVVLVDPITGVATAVGTGTATIQVTAVTTGGAELLDMIDVSSGFLGLEPKAHETSVHGGFQLRATAYDAEQPGTPLLKAGPFVEICEFDACTYTPIPYADPNLYPYREDPNNGLYSDPDASYRLISWYSNNENVATVDEYGHVHAIAEGQAVISAVALPGSDVEQMSCSVVNVVRDLTVSRGPTRFFDDLVSCHGADIGRPMTGSVPHPFDINFYWTGPEEYGGTNEFLVETGLPIVILPSTTNIGLIEDPRSWFEPFPPARAYALQPGFKILIWNWDPMMVNNCGGHRYAGVQHLGSEYRAEYETEWPVMAFYLFDDYLDAPEGWHLVDIPPVSCTGDACGVSATSDEVAPQPYPNWWLDFEWLWDYLGPAP